MKEKKNSTLTDPTKVVIPAKPFDFAQGRESIERAGIQPLSVIPRAGGESSKRKVERQRAVYILTNKRNGTLYIGVTSDLAKRVWEHKNNMRAGFTKKYNLHQLVLYELHDDMESAILREKRLKNITDHGN